MKSAYAYLRISTKTNENGDGFERQRLAITEYASAHDMQVVAEYRDIVTGKAELDNREQMALMRDAMINGEVKVLIVEQADRLARDSIIQEMIVRDFIARGLEIYTAKGDELTDDSPTRALIRVILAGVAAYERSMLTEKLKAARDRKKKETGRCEGRKPYGFYPGEAEVIEKIRIMTMCAWPSRQIAEVLNALKINCRNGSQWQTARVYQIVNSLGGIPAPMPQTDEDREKVVAMLATGVKLGLCDHESFFTRSQFIGKPQSTQLATPKRQEMAF